MTRPSRLRRVPALLALVVALLSLSGCFKVSQDVQVRADGSGSVTLHAEINKKALADLFNNLGADLGVVLPELVTPFRTITRTFPDGTKVRAVDGPERATLDASFDFTGPDDYRHKLQEVNEAIAANPDASLPDDGSIEIRRVRDTMDVTLDPGSFSSGTGDINLSALSGLLDPGSRPEVIVTITMPGSVLTTNGQAQGRTVTWNLLARGAPATLTASSEVEGAGAPTWALALGIGLILLVLVVTLTFLVSQRRRTAAAGGAGDREPEGAWGPAGVPGQPGTATFFPPEPGPPAQGGWPVPPPRPTVPEPAPPAPPPWQPSPWSSPRPSPAPPAPWSGPPAPPPPPVAPADAPAPPGPPAPPATPAAAPGGPAASPAPATVADARAEGAAPATAAGAGAAAGAPAQGPAPWTWPPTARTPPAAPAPSTVEAPPVEPLARRAQPADGDAATTADVPAVAAPVPGWYADPAGGGGLRYWDGAQWTPHTR